MSSADIDRVDKGILYLLQQNARSHTTADIGEKVGVSSSTVANRINDLESAGVITGYFPSIDYEKTDLRHHVLAIATVPITEQGDTADDILSIAGVVSVRELLTSKQNLSIELVGHTQDDIERSLTALNETGVDVERMVMMKRHRFQPYDHFGKQYTSEAESR
ncbi:Lrp/AsnC family transcriptional regulator [Halorientalis pallida]|uniref:Lrp/AsnC family transcriptional regulator n=1 Tax=Halorientalis pallida TaxID=2479928 RepID=UPI003C6F6A00